MERPLPDDVARPVRAHLAALVPADEVSDAWHEVVADVAYWGDRDLVSVLRLAHQVVLQHGRVAPEAAALALVEIGLHDPVTVAAVLDTDPDTARALVERAAASRTEGTAAAAVHARFATRREVNGSPAAPAATPMPVAPAPVEAHHPTDPAPDVQPEPAADPQADLEADPPPSLRIGFDEEPLPDLAALDAPSGPGGRGLVLGSVVLVVVLVVVWVLVR